MAIRVYIIFHINLYDEKCDYIGEKKDMNQRYEIKK